MVSIKKEKPETSSGSVNYVPLLSTKAQLVDYMRANPANQFAVTVDRNHLYGNKVSYFTEPWNAYFAFPSPADMMKQLGNQYPRMQSNPCVCEILSNNPVFLQSYRRLYADIEFYPAHEESEAGREAWVTKLEKAAVKAASKLVPAGKTPPDVFIGANPRIASRSSTHLDGALQVEETINKWIRPEKKGEQGHRKEVTVKGYVGPKESFRVIVVNYLSTAPLEVHHKSFATWLQMELKPADIVDMSVYKDSCQNIRTTSSSKWNDPSGSMFVAMTENNLTKWEVNYGPLICTNPTSDTVVLPMPLARQNAVPTSVLRKRIADMDGKRSRKKVSFDDEKQKQEAEEVVSNTVAIQTIVSHLRSPYNTMVVSKCRPNKDGGVYAEIQQNTAYCPLGVNIHGHFRHDRNSCYVRVKKDGWVIFACLDSACPASKERSLMPARDALVQDLFDSMKIQDDEEQEEQEKMKKEESD